MSRSNDSLPFGFRIVGNLQNDRRLIDWSSAFLAYCDCDERAEVDKESYLSAFCFGHEFEERLTLKGSVKGYAGECWSAWLWFDIDRDEIDDATTDARLLTGTLNERFGLADDELLIFFSGRKGFHIGLPSALWNPKPSNEFHSCCSRFAENVAAVAAFRDWQTAVAAVKSQNAVAAERRANGTTATTLNRATLEFIRDGATTGNRHRRLFSAAANLAKFGCALPLAVALLSEPALDSGLPPAEVRRQIECGLNHGGAAQ